MTKEKNITVAFVTRKTAAKKSRREIWKTMFDTWFRVHSRALRINIITTASTDVLEAWNTFLKNTNKFNTHFTKTHYKQTLEHNERCSNVQVFLAAEWWM